jgi:hypothetical protein
LAHFSDEQVKGITNEEEAEPVYEEGSIAADLAVFEA